MILGEFIRQIEELEPVKTVAVGIAEPHSYRGDYCDVAFKAAPSMTIQEILDVAKSAVGASYENKGESYTMTLKTEVHIAFPGCSDLRAYSHTVRELVGSADSVTALLKFFGKLDDCQADIDCDGGTGVLPDLMQLIIDLWRYTE